MTDIVCLGILVADVLVRPVDTLPARGSLGLVDDVELRGGGCALNTATALARLGLTAAVAGKIGRDPFGDFIIRLLQERGLDQSRLVLDATGDTSTTVALVGADGERTFLHRIGANGTLRIDELDEQALFAARALHVGGALVMPAFDGEPMAELLRRARAAGVMTSIDTVFDPSGNWNRVLACLHHVDLFTPGLTEATRISNVRDPLQAARRLREIGAGAVAVTLGSQGCVVSADDFEGWVEGFAVDAVDGTGAGDAFAAGFIYGNLAGWGSERSARFANAAGALAVTAIGACEGLGDLAQTLALAAMEVSV